MRKWTQLRLLSSFSPKKWEFVLHISTLALIWKCPPDDILVPLLFTGFIFLIWYIILCVILNLRQLHKCLQEKAVDPWWCYLPLWCGWRRLQAGKIGKTSKGDCSLKSWGKVIMETLIQGRQHLPRTSSILCWSRERYARCSEIYTHQRRRKQNEKVPTVCATKYENKLCAPPTQCSHLQGKCDDHNALPNMFKRTQHWVIDRMRRFFFFIWLSVWLLMVMFLFLFIVMLLCCVLWFVLNTP